MANRARKLGQATEATKQKGKGAPRNGNAEDVGGLPTKATRCYETNPANGKGSTRGTTPLIVE